MRLLASLSPNPSGLLSVPDCVPARRKADDSYKPPSGGHDDNNSYSPTPGRRDLSITASGAIETVRMSWNAAGG